MIRINIQFPFDKYGGGGNQFLKAMRKRLIKDNLYEDSSAKADVILFNSHHEFKKVYLLKKDFPEKIFIHRIDGPVHLARGKDRILDWSIFKFNKLIADGTIFQSRWSRRQNRSATGSSSSYETVIVNAPDDELFNAAGKSGFTAHDKTRLVSTSNSPNMRKGFGTYAYLDSHLDFSRYEMTFIGNSPFDFRNIKWIKPVASQRLAGLLKEHDIYITASRNEACSNSLIEALSCGLPAVALNNGGNPELVQQGGELFEGQTDILEKIDRVANNLHHYQSNIPSFFIEKAAQKYYEFAKDICHDVKKGLYRPKQVNAVSAIHFYIMESVLMLWKGTNTLRR